MARIPVPTKIDFLVSPRYPGPYARTAPSLSRLAPEPSIDWQERLAAATVYRAELEALTDEELAKLHAAETDKHAEEIREKNAREERERFFNLPSANADFDHWSKAAHWTLDEAIALSFGKAPEHVNWKNVEPHVKFSPFAFQYSRRRDLAVRAATWKHLFDPVLPGSFLAWCKRTELAVPTELEAAVAARGVKIAEWQTLYEEMNAFAQKLDKDWAEQADKQGIDWLEIVRQRDETIADLQQRIDEMEREQQAHPADAKQEKPLGAKERDSLLKLVIGLAVVAYKYDATAARSDADTVRKWLREGAELLPLEEPQLAKVAGVESQR